MCRLKFRKAGERTVNGDDDDDAHDAIQPEKEQKSNRNCRAPTIYGSETDDCVFRIRCGRQAHCRCSNNNNNNSNNNTINNV